MGVVEDLVTVVVLVVMGVEVDVLTVVVVL